jgi:hypothetical protein
MVEVPSGSTAKRQTCDIEGTGEEWWELGTRGTRKVGLGTIERVIRKA